MLSPASGVSGGDLYTSKGTAKGIVFGGAANLLLNPLDEHAMASLRNSIGIGYLYLTYMFEVSRSLKDERPDFSRFTQSFAISFESAL